MSRALFSDNLLEIAVYAHNFFLDPRNLACARVSDVKEQRLYRNYGQLNLLKVSKIALNQKLIVRVGGLFKSPNKHFAPLLASLPQVKC